MVRPLTPDAPELDGVAGLHFRSYADWVAWYTDHPEDAARAAADSARFMDLQAAETLVAVETVLATVPSPPVGTGNQPAGKAHS
ncbi:hypothetical protein ACU686_09680 [Yinghuangia aomiensis]